MKTFLTFTLSVALTVSLSAVSYAQGDLQKIGNFLQGLQQLQQQQDQQRRPPAPPQNGSNKQYRYSDPNSSGNQNRGDFGRNDFFGPGGGQPVPSRPRPTYPGNSYPNQTYPNNSYPSPQPTYPSPSARTTRYPDPPTAPARKYSGQPIKISCAADSAGVCNYELKTASGSKFPYTISAGKAQTLSETTSWVFRYRPTTSAAWQEYRLRGGKNYVVRKTNNQWQLYMVP